LAQAAFEHIPHTQIAANLLHVNSAALAAQVRAPVAIIRGEWDSMCTDEDAGWLFEAFKSSPIRRDIKIGRATHLMHLEENRHALYRETQTFLEGERASEPTRA
jgi:hypothetical protein